ncbi:sulfate transport system permease protein CysT [Escherichia coli MS 79-10]|nr:sulfate transport system permease protein CysT [Escherichia coli MS 79-10]
MSQGRAPLLAPRRFLSAGSAFPGSLNSVGYGSIFTCLVIVLPLMRITSWYKA